MIEMALKSQCLPQNYKITQRLESLASGCDTLELHQFIRHWNGPKLVNSAKKCFWFNFPPS